MTANVVADRTQRDSSSSRRLFSIPPMRVRQFDTYKNVIVSFSKASSWNRMTRKSPALLKMHWTQLTFEKKV